MRLSPFPVFMSTLFNSYIMTQEEKKEKEIVNTFIDCNNNLLSSENIDLLCQGSIRQFCVFAIMRHMYFFYLN